MSTSGGLTGVGFPTYSGAGNPEGVQTGAVAESYVDTTNGALYWKIAGAGNTGWQLAGAGDATVPGVMALNGATYLIAPTNHRAIIGDAFTWSGQGNGLSYVSTTVDGNQRVEINLGSTDQYSWVFAASGLTTVPGGIKSAPAASSVATAAFSTLAVDTPLQSSLAYDVFVSGVIKITSATAGTIALGVGAGATPTTSPFLTATTSATALIVPYSAVVPAGYYLSLVSGGTIVVASITAVATPL